MTPTSQMPNAASLDAGTICLVRPATAKPPTKNLATVDIMSGGQNREQPGDEGDSNSRDRKDASHESISFVYGAAAPGIRLRLLQGLGCAGL